MSNQYKIFTDQQIKDYLAYEKVRAAGKYNMFDPRARKVMKLSAAEYGFVMDNFVALAEAAEQATKPSKESK